MGLLKNYKVAIIDASIFTKRLPKNLIESLPEVQLWAPHTFLTDTMQMEKMLPVSKRAIYISNLNDIEKFVQVTDQEDADTWDMLKQANDIGKSIPVVITANKLLIQSIVLDELNVDIYDVNNERFIFHGIFHALRRDFEFKPKSKDVLLKSDVCISEGTVLYKSDGSLVRLTEEFNFGAEAVTYKVSLPNKLAKIFDEKNLTIEKINNVRNIIGANKELDIQWASFPVDMLYSDSKCRYPVGFLQEYVFSKGNLDDSTMYLGDLDALSEEELDKRISDSIDLCIKIIRQVLYLNVYGFFVSDFNMSNLAISKNDCNNMIFWDTDSFGKDGYFSSYSAGFKTSRDYDLHKKSGAIGFCIEALYLLVFQILTLGAPPVSEITGKYIFDDFNDSFYYRKDFVPQNLLNHFNSVFTKKSKPSTEILLQELSETLTELKNAPRKNYKYRELIYRVFPDIAEQENASDKPERIVIKLEKIYNNATTNNYKTQTSGKPMKKKSVWKKIGHFFTYAFITTATIILVLLIVLKIMGII